MIVVAPVGAAGGSAAAAAAVALAVDAPVGAGVLLDLAGGRAWRPGVVASAAAREVEERLAAHLPAARVASRGRLCHLALPPGPERLDAVAAAAAIAREATFVVHAPPQQVHALLDRGRVEVAAALLRADLPADRSLTALAARGLRERGVRVTVLKRPLGWLAAQLALHGAGPAARSGLSSRLLARLGAGISTDRDTGSVRDSDSVTGSAWGRAAVRSAAELDTDTDRGPAGESVLPAASGPPAVVWRHARSRRP